MEIHTKIVMSKNCFVIMYLHKFNTNHIGTLLHKIMARFLVYVHIYLTSMHTNFKQNEK